MLPDALLINGKPSATPPIMQSGQMYVSLSSLSVSAPVKIIIPINSASGLLRDTGLKYAVKAPTLRVWLKTDAGKSGDKTNEKTKSGE